MKQTFYGYFSGVVNFSAVFLSSLTFPGDAEEFPRILFQQKTPQSYIGKGIHTVFMIKSGYNRMDPCVM